MRSAKATLALGLILACSLAACGRPAKKPSWPETQEIVKAMICNLQSADHTVRCCAATCLGTIGPEAAPAIPALEIAQHDCESSVREAARIALDKITCPISERRQRSVVRS